MAEIARISRSRAKENPGQAFNKPADIVAEIMLTRGEKIGALERWRTDVLHEMTATGEGMQAQGPSERLARLLRQIDAALRELAREDDPVPAK